MLTIGYGTTSTKPGGHDDGTITEGMVIDEAQAIEYLSQDLEYFERVVESRVTSPTQQWMFDALVSFTFNLGEGNLNKSTLLKLHNQNDYEGAAAEFIKWNKAGGQTLNGLTRRRASEERRYRDEDNYLVESVDEMAELGYPVV